MISSKFIGVARTSAP